MTAATAPLSFGQSGRAGHRHAKVDRVNTGEMAGLVGTILVAPYFKDWLNTRRDRRRAKQREPFAANQQMEALFGEGAQLRSDLREEIAVLRSDLHEAQRRTTVLTHRIADMEEELTEWRAGQRGLAGVWVAVPFKLWADIRGGVIPTLPPHLPGEVRP